MKTRRAKAKRGKTKKVVKPTPPAKAVEPVVITPPGKKTKARAGHYEERVLFNMAHMGSALKNWYLGCDGRHPAPTFFNRGDQCGLCGRHPVKNFFYISSTNNWRLRVGSECVTRFPSSRGLGVRELLKWQQNETWKNVWIPMVAHIERANELDGLIRSALNESLLEAAKRIAWRMHESGVHSLRDRRQLLNLIKLTYME
jgi:hypothetical protein